MHSTVTISAKNQHCRTDRDLPAIKDIHVDTLKADAILEQ